MTYVDTINSNRRLGTLAMVGAIHVAAGYALVTGLAATIIPKIEPEIKTIFLPEPATPKPTPTVTPHGRPDTTTLVTPPPPDTRNPFDQPGPIELPPIGTGDRGLGIDEVTFPGPTPSPGPTFATKPARPKGNPGLWVTTNDYPQSAIRSEAEGVVKFRLSVGTNGKVIGCEVTGSSGTEALDQAACDKLMLRGKFEPASDSTGALVAGSYTGAVRWQLPRD
ncbi:energy transducer TonB [Novosphingobium ginsenosidimutans]|nr:energy transducer TonB [Novosphingobium ginsenosidimutans]